MQRPSQDIGEHLFPYLRLYLKLDRTGDSFKVTVLKTTWQPQVAQDKSPPQTGCWEFLLPALALFSRYLGVVRIDHMLVYGVQALVSEGVRPIHFWGL